MDKGTKVYRAYVYSWNQQFTSWIDEGEVSGIVQDGVPFVTLGKTLQPLDDRWHATRHQAQRDIHRGLVLFIGEMQAKADEMADELLHADLTTEEVTA